MIVGALVMGVAVIVGVSFHLNALLESESFTKRILGELEGIQWDSSTVPMQEKKSIFFRTIQTLLERIDVNERLESVLNILLLLNLIRCIQNTSTSVDIVYEQEYFTDIADAVAARTLAWYHDWPVAEELASSIAKYKAKLTVGFAKLTETGLFPTQRSTSAFLRFYERFSFLEPPVIHHGRVDRNPLKQQRGDSQIQKEDMLAHKVEQRLARLLNVKIATYKDIAQRSGSVCYSSDSLASFQFNFELRGAHHGGAPGPEQPDRDRQERARGNGGRGRIFGVVGQCQRRKRAAAAGARLPVEVGPSD